MLACNPRRVILQLPTIRGVRRSADLRPAADEGIEHGYRWIRTRIAIFSSRARKLESGFIDHRRTDDGRLRQLEHLARRASGIRTRRQRKITRAAIALPRPSINVSGRQVVILVQLKIHAGIQIDKPPRNRKRSAEWNDVELSIAHRRVYDRVVVDFAPEKGEEKRSAICRQRTGEASAI